MVNLLLSLLYQYDGYFATTAAPKFSGVGEGAKKKNLGDIDKILKAANNFTTPKLLSLEEVVFLASLNLIKTFQKVAVTGILTMELIAAMEAAIAADLHKHFLSYNSMLLQMGFSIWI